MALSKKINLFNHQQEMYNAMKENTSGILQAPTGSGKTYPQAAIIKDYVVKGGSIVVVSSPRIGLSNQLSSVVESYLAGEEVPSNLYSSLLMHSGAGVELTDDDMSLEEIKALALRGSEIEATTFVERLYTLIDYTSNNNSTLVIFTTYHSTEKVFEAIERKGSQVDLHINDEAHYLTREDFNPILDNTQANKRFFFTATPIVSVSNLGRGMNNSDKFGTQIYALETKKAIDLGLVVKPKALLIRSELNNLSQHDIDNEVGELVYEGFKNTRIEFDQLGAKMLVATRGALQIQNFINSEEYATLLEEGVEILTVHSNKDLLTYNGEVITRQKFETLKDKLGQDVNVELIIVHYDILSEGIDIPGLLSVLILRELKLAKFLQTIGRVLRVYRDNPSLKQFGLVMFPDIITSDNDSVASFTRMLYNLTQEGFLSTQELNEALKAGLPEEEVDDLLEKNLLFSVSEEIDMMLYTSSLDTMDGIAF